MHENMTRKVKVICPYCDILHEVKLLERHTSSMVKHEVVDYIEHVYLCEETLNEENEFVTGQLMDDNLLKARDAYRMKHQLLTADEIAQIRKKYQMTQLEFSNVLGWGDVTVTRYESKHIQDETYDSTMRRANDNPFFVLENLEKHSLKFSTEKYDMLLKKVMRVVGEDNGGYYSIGKLKSHYAAYHEPSVFNGNQPLKVDKLISVVNYFAKHAKQPMLVKMMKLLWYADALSYKRMNRSITGIVYKHMPFGALPLGYLEIRDLPHVVCKDQIVGEYVGCQFIQNNDFEIRLSKEETDILDTIVQTFKDASTQQIVESMHGERAYVLTKEFTVISYEDMAHLNGLE